jgi:hypothetical protein
MGRYNNDETSFLLGHEPKVAPPKFPLGLFPASIRPYLELIRLEKVFSTTIRSKKLP